MMGIFFFFQIALSLKEKGEDNNSSPASV